MGERTFRTNAAIVRHSRPVTTPLAVFDGIVLPPQAFLAVFSGANTGKMTVHLGD